MAEMTTDAQTPIVQDIESSEQTTNKDLNDGSNPTENTRSYIAKLYVWAFFIVIGVVFVVGVIKCFEVKDYTDMLITVSGVLSGPLGFIVGYYFKASRE